MHGVQSDLPGVIAWPPILYGVTLLIGLALHWLWPAYPLPSLPARIAGALLVLGSTVLARWAELTMHRAGTWVRCNRPATTVVTNGPFRYTRNPLYVSLTGMYVGLTLLVNALWPLPLLAPLMVLMYWGVILREERDL